LKKKKKEVVEKVGGAQRSEKEKEGIGISMASCQEEREKGYKGKTGEAHRFKAKAR